MPYLGESGRRPYHDPERIAADPAYDEIVCHCERVTRAELRDALASDIVARGPGRPAPQNPRYERPLPGLLLRRERLCPARVPWTLTFSSSAPARRACRPPWNPATPRRARTRGGPGGRARRRATAQLAHRVRAPRPAPSTERARVRADPRWRRCQRGRRHPARRRPSRRSTRTTATITSPRGVETVQASAVLLATACRERPRAARLVPGDRPHGVMTTGELQQRVYLGGDEAVRAAARRRRGTRQLLRGTDARARGRTRHRAGHRV